MSAKVPKRGSLRPPCLMCVSEWWGREWESKGRKVSTSQAWVKSHKAMSFLLVSAVIAELLHKHIWNLLGSQTGRGHSSWEGESAGACLSWRLAQHTVRLLCFPGITKASSTHWLVLLYSLWSRVELSNTMEGKPWSCRSGSCSFESSFHRWQKEGWDEK